MEGHDSDVVASSEAFRDRLRRRIGQQRFATWFEGAVSITVSRNATEGTEEALISASSSFEQGLLRKQFLTDLMEVAAETLGESSRVRFGVASQPVAATAQDAAPAATQPRRAAPPSAAPRKATNRAQQPLQAAWVTGDSNAAATRLASRLVAGSPCSSPVLVWGPSGVGKTELLRLIAEGMRARKKRVLAISAEQFLRGFVDAARGGGFPSFRQKHQGVDALMVDDVQQLIGKKRTLDEFRQTLDGITDAGGTVILSADRGVNELRDLGPEIASRLSGGLPVEIEMPGVDMREHLVNRAANRLGLELPPTVARPLASRLLGGGREISGAVNRLILLHETFDTPLDERLAHQVAEDTNRLSTPPVRLGDIQRAVCGVFGVDAKTLRSDKRTKAVSEPRMLAMFLARKMTGSPWSEIGDYFGRRSHSTVIAAHRRVEKLLESPEPTRLVVGDLGETIRRVEAALRTA